MLKRAAVASLGLLTLAVLLGVALGPVAISPLAVLQGIGQALAGNSADPALTATQQAILTQIRLPRVLLAALVGGALATSGTVYQTVFRNPLADPYLLGVASGAGLGATIAILGNLPQPVVAIAAFLGGLLTVALTFTVAGKRFADPRTLLLAGIAVGSFATAIQSFLFQSNSGQMRSVYSWIFGQLTVANYGTVAWTAGFLAIALGVLFWLGGRLDGLLLSDEEAHSLGLKPQRLRVIAIVAATLAAATAVSAAGLIGFVGLVIPHLVRLTLHRVTTRALHITAAVGGAFLILADLLARTIIAPGELPIGVITAFIGAPFFLFVLVGGARR